MSTNTQPQNALSPIDQKKRVIKAWIEKASRDLQRGLAKHLTVDRMMRIAMSAVSRQPLLAECTPQSIVLALINAGETGLEPNGYEAHLVPYKNNKVDPPVYEAQFQPDYKGLVQLAYRSSLVLSIDADAAYEQDEFEYERGSQEFIRHVPADSDDRGKLKYAWASARIQGGGFKFVVLNRAQIEKHRKSSQAFKQGHGPWKDHEESMWIKTAVKMLAKFIPRSAELQRAVTLDNQAEIGDRQTYDPDVIDVLALGHDQRALSHQAEHTPNFQPQTQSSELAERINRRRANKQPTTPPQQSTPTTASEPSEEEKHAWYDGEGVRQIEASIDEAGTLEAVDRIQARMDTSAAQDWQKQAVREWCERKRFELGKR